MAQRQSTGPEHEGLGSSPKTAEEKDTMEWGVGAATWKEGSMF